MRFSIIVIFTFFTVTVSGQKQFNLQGGIENVSLNSYTSFFIDTTKELTLPNVKSRSFAPLDANGLRMGSTLDVIWFKLSFSNPDNSDADYIISFTDPTIYELTLFDGDAIKQSGVITPTHQRDVACNQNAFNIYMPPKSSKTIYIRARSINKATYNLSLITKDLFFQELIQERFLLGLYYGSLIVVFIFSIFLILTTRLRLFAYYAGYVLFVGVLTGASDGITAEYFHFWVQWKEGFQDAASGIVANILGLLFMILFLEIKNWSPRLYKVNVIYMLVSGLISLILLQGEFLVVFDFLIGLAFFQIIIMVYTGYRAMREKVPQAGYFFWAYVVFGGFVFYFALNMFRLVPYNFWAQYSIHLGYGASMIILSYGVGVRMYSFYRKLLSQEKEKQEIIKQKNEELEEQVILRTQFLKEQEGNLRSIIENHPNSIVLIDGEYKLIDCNSRFKEAFNQAYNKELITQKSMLEQIPVENVRTQWKVRYDSALEGKVATYNDNYTINGVTRFYDIRIYPIKYGNQVRGLTVFSAEVTRQMQAQELLKEQNEMLKKVNEELDSFVYSASHDLKAPLASILGLINISKVEPDLNEREKYLDMMEISIKRLDQFIRDIVDYSRNARTETELTKIDMEELVTTIFNDLKYLVDQKQVALKFTSDIKAVLYLDETRLRVIIRNIMSNALKYGLLKDAENIIEVNADVNKNRLILSLTDNGPGIKTEHQKHIFDMFYRAHESTSGTGLGLYIVKETVDKLGGTIVLESIPNQGSTFTVSLPNNDSSGK